jgi:CheY-like chemotaxis protein
LAAHSFKRIKTIEPTETPESLERTKPLDSSFDLNEPNSLSDNWFCDNLEAIRACRLDGLKVLIADDCEDNQVLFGRILKAAGAIVVFASDGEIAVRVESEINFDLIIMDIRMPICDGYEATRLIRARGFSGPIIALTANHFIDERIRCLDAGCDAFYFKPIDRLSLLGAVKRATEARAMSS